MGAGSGYDDEYWDRTFEVELSEDTYQGTLHDSLPVAVREHLEEDAEAREYFEIRSPNRLWVEGESSGYWEDTEDFVITGSHEGGELIMGQVVSCDRKDYPYEKMESQVEYFLASNMFSKEELYDTWEYAFVLGVDMPPEEVEAEEKRLEEAIEDGKTYEVDMLVRKLDLDDMAEGWELDMDPAEW